jgi:hypothetical protein
MNTFVGLHTAEDSSLILINANVIKRVYFDKQKSLTIVECEDFSVAVKENVQRIYELLRIR